MSNYEDIKHEYPFRAKYKKRHPDPGVCVIVSMDFREKRLSMTNGCCRYFPNFEEVTFLDEPLKTLETTNEN